MSCARRCRRHIVDMAGFCQVLTWREGVGRRNDFDSIVNGVTDSSFNVPTWAVIRSPLTRESPSDCRIVPTSR
jgi:hypothetical protein